MNEETVRSVDIVFLTGVAVSLHKVEKELAGLSLGEHFFPHLQKELEKASSPGAQFPIEEEERQRLDRMHQVLQARYNEGR